MSFLKTYNKSMKNCIALYYEYHVSICYSVRYKRMVQADRLIYDVLMFIFIMSKDRDCCIVPINTKVGYDVVSGSSAAITEEKRWIENLQRMYNNLFYLKLILDRVIIIM